MKFNEAVISGSSLLKRNFASIFGAGVVSYTLVFGLLFGTGRLIVAIAHPPKPFDPTAYWHSLATHYKLCWLLGFVLAAWTPQLMTHAGAAWIALREANGEQGSASGAVKAVFARLLPLLLLALLIGVPAFMGSLLLIIPGLIVSAIGVMIVPEMIIRNLTLGAAIRSGVRVGMKHAKVVGLVLVLFVAAWLVFVFVVVVIGAAWHPSFFVTIPFLATLMSSWFGAIVSKVCIEYHHSQRKSMVQTSSSAG